MFDATVRELFLQAGQMHNLDPAALAAIAQTESGGIVTTRIKGRDEPLIRFEGHYFDKRLSPAEQATARALKLSSPKAGAIPNPAGQAARWQMLERAARIDRVAAYESTSWGVGQVMGAHWHWLGYPSVEEMTETVRSSVTQQIELMTRFIVYGNLRDVLNKHDWRKLAHSYNGPLFAKNKYDLKLAQAYALYRPLFPPFRPLAVSTA
ncbi:N-acetylmuramidase family protein [Pseudochrobactrum sp. sp1633]|uniref:N-acetylmuramidase family protein n=1 Tax=Pseudochrobactrum sp. sp1633 TaxID=3036706 RepID=UPI0025A649B3|nr:N-acetylmuramidase family protein [Pseudochrobactrum sp. sp1633]MDM8346003.1 N-acetylmuramidase family protein [Pseudochrobactrum sp. sp1633]HWD13846.1 N-acetylmuramidase family protein [Pseudochrobactrum sp.]